MILAALGNICGNPHALDAALADIDAAGVLSVVCTGNCVVGGSGGDHVVARLRERGLPCVQGEQDRLLIRFRKKETTRRPRMGGAEAEAFERAYRNTTSANLEFLRGLPRQLNLTIDGVRICVCHGSLGSQSEYVDADTPTHRLVRQREMAPVDIIVCGGAPEPFARQIDDTLFVGPGSVDAGTGLARYAVISTEARPWSAAFPEVRY